MSSGAPSSSYALASSGGPSRVFWLAVGAGTGMLAASLLWRTTKTTYEQYVPLQYQYRPGTISGWLASALSKYSTQRRNQRPVRVYLDGCFDMMHYGHANALRQAKTAGDQLVVGLIPDSEILRCKGPPVLNEEERFVLVDAVKWVDEVIKGVPYDLSPEFIQELFTTHRIDYIIHGDDPCLLPDGTDAYAHAKKLGRFRMIKRTEGVSTTDIVGRMLTCTRVNPQMIHGDEPHPLAKSFSIGLDRSREGGGGSREGGSAAGDGQSGKDEEQMRRDAARTTLSKFLPTSRRLVQFSNGRLAPEGAKIIYIDGAFDCFHPGHVKILKAARAQGDFLLVGLHTDEDVQERRGLHLPIMNLHERALSVLACKYVDEVIMGSPTLISEDLLTTFNISLVVRGTISETGHHEIESSTTSSIGSTTSSSSSTRGGGEGGKRGERGTGQGGVVAVVSGSGEEGMGRGKGGESGSGGGGTPTHGQAAAHIVDEGRYQCPRTAGIFQRLPSPGSETARNIIQRIVAKREEYEARNAKKVKSEVAYYTDKKEYVAEL